MNLKPLAIAITLLPLAVAANTRLGVHEHGFGQLNLAQNGEQLMIELISPAADIVGFEHNPATHEEQTAVDHAINKGLNAAGLFTLPAAAGCVLKQASHITADEQDDHDHAEHEHEHEHEHHDEHAHRDVNLHYSWQCSQPEALNQLDAAGLFKAFPSFSRLELQGILASGQMAATLTPEQPQASW